MKKKWICGSWRLPESLKRVLMLMKIIVFILMISFSTISANTFSQTKVSIKLNDVKISEVLKEISQKTEYEFLYNNEEINNLGKVSVNVVDVKIRKILDICFKGKGVDYKIQDKVILISPITLKKLQKKGKEIKGKVVDEKGNSLPGVAIQIQGTSLGVASDIKGKFTILVKKGDVLKFSFMGYKTQILLIEDQEKLDVKLFPQTENLEEVSVVAFGTQKKESVVSSITSVKSDALKSSSSDLTSAFAGKIAGMIGWQTGGLPGAMTEEEMNTKFYIRGITSFQSKANIDPLILLDGVEVSKLDLARIDPDDIESFNVLKDASATAMYGARGANGVISVVTKKGEAGSVYTSFRYEKIWSMPTREIDVVSAVDYMKYFNEAHIGRNPGSTPVYSAERIKNTNDPRFPSWVYPGVDWYDQLFKNKVINNHYALNVRGGSDKIQYYASVTFNDDEGMIKVDKLNQFDPNIKSKQTTFRTNLNVNLTKTAKLTLNSFSTLDKYTGPLEDVREAYYLAFRSNPVEFAPTYPADKEHAWPHVLFGGGGSSDNPYAKIQRGYKERKRFSTINKFEYIQNLSFLVKGLEFRASAAMSKTGYFQTGYANIPADYSLISYDAATGEHVLSALSEDAARRTLEMNSYYSKQSSSISVEYQVKALHSANWGNHQTSLTAVITAQEKDNSIPGNLQQSLPNRNLGYSARASYGYKDRYFLEASVGYNGSERFSKKNKMGIFPAYGLAWVASKENFLRSIDDWLDYLKMRVSYGKVGNDGVINDPRFAYLQNILNPQGIALGNNLNSSYYYKVKSYGNPSTTWEISEQTNFGLDLKLFKGLIDITFDAYKETRHNIYSMRTVIPTTMGLEQAPLDNVGKVSSSGFDFSGKIQHAFNPDFWFIVNTTFTYNKAKYKVIEEASNKKPWQRKVGKEISQQFGYIAEGLFYDYEEIQNSPDQAGNLMPGDIKYRDVDGNGKIDINDAVPIGHPTTPRIIYGLSSFIHYKNFEFNISFQGSGDRSFWIDPSKVTPFDENGALLQAFADDHWTESNPKTKPLWPRLSTSSILAHNPQENYEGDENGESFKSTYFMQNGKFLRCKAIELSYYLNSDWLKKFKLRKCKFYARINNPFIISDFKIWDVELGDSGFNYPIQKTYSLGVNLSF